MPIVPLYGHAALRERLRDAVQRDALPASLLFHGPRGAGKQRLALWLGQLLVCTGVAERPCGRCQSCRYAAELGHPDLHWFFPRPRLKDADAGPPEVRADYVDAVAERAAARGLYAPPSGTEAIYVATVRAIVHSAALSPALGRRKVFILGDVERMVPQEGAEAAANAFLKLLEEPPTDTTLVLTSSEPGALLPTIRSRVVAMRVAPLSDAEVGEFLGDDAVRAMLDADSEAPQGEDERIRAAAGLPGALLGAAGRSEALAQARRILESRAEPVADRYRIAVEQGVGKARGAFSETLDAVTVLLHDRARAALGVADEAGALAAARAIDAVERAKALAHGNVSPQLVAAALLNELCEVLDE